MGRFPEFAAPLTPGNLPLSRAAAGSVDPRILIVRTKANGDILMGTPLLAALRKNYPNANLTWMVERCEREAVDANPYVDEMLLWDTAYWKSMPRNGLYPLYGLRIWQLRKLLQSRRFDILVSFEPEDWPFLPWASGAKKTIGVFDTFREYHKSTKTSRRVRFYSDVFTYHDLPPHRTDQYLLPLRALHLPPVLQTRDKQMTMGFLPADAASVASFLRENGVVLEQHKRLVVVAPMTGWPSRCWPQERYAELCAALLAEHGESSVQIVLIGSGKPSEKQTLENIAGELRLRGQTPIVAAGSLRFRQMAALIAQSALVIGGDSGPMHVAAAVGVPYVALFGPSPVPRFAPLSGKGVALAHEVPCGPCHQRECPNKAEETRQICLRLTTVEEVQNAARVFLVPAGESLRKPFALPVADIFARSMV